MKDLLKNNYVFICGFSLCWIALCMGIILTSKSELHLWLNSYHCTWADYLFKYVTIVGEIGAYIIAFALLFKRLGDTLFILSAELGTGLIVQIIKHIVHAPRPKVFFNLAQNPDILPLVEGVKLHSSNSFPSGHTASFIAMFFALSIIISGSKLQNKNIINLLLQFICLLIAVLGAYSRIYLSQHFAEDVFAGGLIAMITTTALYFLFKLLNNKYTELFDKRINYRALLKIPRF